MKAELPADFLSQGSIAASRRRSTIILIAAFWILTFAILSARAAITDSLPFSVIAPRRLIAAGFGTALCLTMVYVLGVLRSRSFSERVAWGVAGAVAMSIAQTLFILMLYRVLLPMPGTRPFVWAESAQWVMVWLGYFLAWTGTHLALTYHWEAQDRQRQVSVMRELAQEARIAALRYQVNPHFLFNTLNAISGLVLEGRNRDAEAMLLNLSTFLRSTLSTQAGGVIALSEELALQRLYLAIEESRFSERMRVAIDVPAALASAAVPALILQPLIENAVRYGVGQSEALTTIRIGAERRGADIVLTVADDGIGGRNALHGTGVGLANVRDRLQAHFGDHAALLAEPGPRGGFRAEIVMPWTPTA